MIKVIKDYLVLSLLGKGSFGAVYKVQKNNDYYAMKIFDLSEKENKYEEYIESEIKILSQIKNDYIIKMYETFKFEKNKICLVMELCEHGDLFKLIINKKNSNTKFTESEIKNYFYEICQGLNYLHKNKIIHRDLKTMNIFLTKDNHIKIGDFGVSKKLNNNIYAYTFIGTPYYLSPEMCRNKAYDEKTDMWSLGCILYELITFKKPFDSTSQMGIFMKILSDPPAPLEKSIKGSYSHKLLNLIYFLLEKNPKKRFNIQQVFNYGIFQTLNNMKSVKNFKDDNNKLIKQNSSQKIINNTGPIRPERKDNNDSKRIRTNPSNKNQLQSLVKYHLIIFLKIV